MKEPEFLPEFRFCRKRDNRDASGGHFAKAAGDGKHRRNRKTEALGPENAGLENKLRRNTGETIYLGKDREFNNGG